MHFVTFVRMKDFYLKKSNCNIARRGEIATAPT